MFPQLIIHGGAGRAMRDPSRAPIIEQALLKVLDEVWETLAAGAEAVDAVLLGCRRLEDDPIFNAGTGSVIQSDGQIRMSASLMDGATQRFSAVINAQRVQNPIMLAHALQEMPDRVLADPGVAELARRLGVPVYDPMTPRRLREWLSEYEQSFSSDTAEVVAQGQPKGTGTIGVVARDLRGRLVAGTSTGGRGFEAVGRVSDCGGPAGNYAAEQAAVSCTGVGEEIVEEGLATRIVVRVVDGLSLLGAFERSFDEAHRRGRSLGAIGIDAQGQVCWGKTSEILLSAYHTGQSRGHTLGLPLGCCVGAAP